MPVPHLESSSFAPNWPELLKVGMNVSWPGEFCAATNCNCLWGFYGGRNCPALQWMIGGIIFIQTRIINLCTFFFQRKESK